jgi:predicted enzyme related to lactoylglutathione lyase
LAVAGAGGKIEVFQNCRRPWAVHSDFEGEAMAETAIATTNKPIWIDLATKDADAARTFYEQLFGWKVEVNSDPQYGGYGLAKRDGKDVAGIGGTQSPDQPSAWSLYIGTDDISELSRRVEAAGGRVIAPAFDVGDQGRMAVFQDPVGAFISAWQSTRMGGFQTQGSNAYGWAELNARSVENALPFYEQLFGWSQKRMPVPGSADYIEFQADGDTVVGATELNPHVPAGTPNHWLVYFAVDDVKDAFDRAIRLGASETVAPEKYFGGEFAILVDPQGAAFGLFKSTQQS